MNIQRLASFIVLVLLVSSVVAQKKGIRKPVQVSEAQSSQQFGQFKDFKLDNGLRILLIEDHEQAQVSFQLFVDRPIILEGDYAGTGEVMGDLLISGTELRTKPQIDEAVDDVQAIFTTDSRGGTISGESRHAERMISLLADCLLNPIFPQEEFDVVVEQKEAALIQQREDPQAIAEHVAKQLRFGNEHPYGEQMTLSTLRSITLSACRNFYSRYFRPQISYLVVVGDIGEKETRELAETYLGDWTSRGKLFVEFFDYPQPPKARQVNFVPRSSAEQSVIQVTYPVILKPGRDVIAAELLNQILGAESTGRLSQNLEEGDVYSDLVNDTKIGYFSANLDVQNDVASDAVKLVLSEMNRLREVEVTAEELQQAKDEITAAFSKSLELPETSALFALNTVRNRLPRNYYANYLEELAKVEPGDIQRMAQEYLIPERAQIIVVGEKSVADQLRHLDADGTVEFFSSGGAKQEMMGLITTEDITPEQIVDNYVRAIGGQERILEISDLTTEMEATVQGMQMLMRQEKKMGEKMHMTVSMSGMTVSETILNGEQAKMLQMGAEQPIDASTIAELQEQSHIFPEARFRELGYTLQLGDTEMLDDKKAYVVRTTGPAGKVLVEYFDTSSSLRLRTITISDSATITVDYSDYREVDGVLYPHKVITSGVMPTPIVFELKTLTFNDGLDNTRFEVK